MSQSQIFAFTLDVSELSPRCLAIDVERVILRTCRCGRLQSARIEELHARCMRGEVGFSNQVRQMSNRCLLLWRASSSREWLVIGIAIGSDRSRGQVIRVVAISFDRCCEKWTMRVYAKFWDGGDWCYSCQRGSDDVVLEFDRFVVGLRNFPKFLSDDIKFTLQRFNIIRWIIHK